MNRTFRLLAASFIICLSACVGDIDRPYFASTSEDPPRRIDSPAPPLCAPQRHYGGAAQVVIDKNMTDDGAAAMTLAVNEWNAFFPDDIFVAAFDDIPPIPKRDPAAIYVFEKDFDDPRTLGYYETGWGSKQFIQLTLTNRGNLWLPQVAMHELGHALGLDHDDNTPDSLMYPYSNAMPWSQKISSKHIETIWRCHFFFTHVSH